MTKLILLILASSLLAACSTVKVKTVDPRTDAACEASYTRFWFEQEGLRVEVCGGKAAVTKTSNDTEALNSLVPLLVKGAALP